MKLTPRYYVLLGFIFIAVTALFWPSFFSYFFQDDWFSLSISRAKNPAEFVNFFLPRSDVIYYRPLGMQVPFFLVQSIFGLQPFPFRLATLFIHFLNGYLVYRLLFFFVKEKRLSEVGAFLYLTSATHMIVFFWAATFAFVLGPLFYFLCFWWFLIGKHRLSLVAFILGLLTNELVITLPMILLVGTWAKLVKQKKWRLLMPYFITAAVYVVVRFVTRFPTSGGYTLLTSVHQLFLNLRNYVLWSLNWPDEIHNQFVSFFILNPLFVKNFLPYLLIFSLSTFICLSVFVFAPLAWGSRKNINRQQVWFGMVWFLFTLSPVLYFSKHYFSYYVPIPLFGLLMIGCGLFLALKKQQFVSSILLCLVAVAWYVAAWTTIRLDLKIHWAPQRAVRAEKVVNRLQAQFPEIPNGSVVVIPQTNGNEENTWAMGEQNGIRFLYKDPSLVTFFGKLPDAQKAFPATSVDRFFEVDLD